MEKKDGIVILSITSILLSIFWITLTLAFTLRFESGADWMMEMFLLNFPLLGTGVVGFTLKKYWIAQAILFPITFILDIVVFFPPWVY